MCDGEPSSQFDHVWALMGVGGVRGTGVDGVTLYGLMRGA